MCRLRPPKIRADIRGHEKGKVMERLDCVECSDVREEVWAKELIAHRCGNEGAGWRLGFTVGSPKPEPYKNMPIEPPAWCPRRKGVTN